MIRSLQRPVSPTIPACCDLGHLQAVSTGSSRKHGTCPIVPDWRAMSRKPGRVSAAGVAHAPDGMPGREGTSRRAPSPPARSIVKEPTRKPGAGGAGPQLNSTAEPPPRWTSCRDKVGAVSTTFGSEPPERGLQSAGAIIRLHPPAARENAGLRPHSGISASTARTELRPRGKADVDAITSSRIHARWKQRNSLGTGPPPKRQVPREPVARVLGRGGFSRHRPPPARENEPRIPRIFRILKKMVRIRTYLRFHARPKGMIFRKFCKWLTFLPRRARPVRPGPSAVGDATLRG